MYFSDAVAKEIEERGRPLLTEYDFYLLSHRVYQNHQRADIHIQNPPRYFDQTVVRRTIRQLERKRLIVRDLDFKGEVWQALRAPPVATAEEAICLVDPFAYVAYLSAFERYGLTDRSPKSLQILTYPSPQWGKERRNLMRDELPSELIGQPVPAPMHIKNRRVVRRRPVDVFHTKRLGLTHIIRPTAIRIATIGQAFLDGLDQPRLCGGMRHVLEIWQKHAGEYEQDIIEVIDRRASDINKVRAGYIFDTYIDARHPVVQSWTKFAQRGGSRKLDPSAPYASTFSEKWMISLNV